MLTQDVSEELTKVLRQIQSEGKEPTIALVKSRLNIVVPIPALIKVIKNWKQSKQVPKIEVAAEAHDDKERIAKLEKQVADLTTRLKELEEKFAKR
ncbi:hypothetical protein GCM10007938_10960 [Vibrio zhanjiangensis]|uniref:KfrA N-terminal DNA-binding domain-containing protein n=1 Tax=Vibrio zhanjiangensis TaxID=1046128 RepID=A0ABQ6EWG5_9VIBR|nr:hypothetical protein [Vibrio zhanjiangensis]GLT17319.1 hypothetical protein GCM10007938_10960 [Vibrio zhanjiangensis]